MEPPARRFRFSIEADIFLLRKVREQDPYKAPSLWFAIAEKLSLAFGKPISARAIRERCDLLLAQFAIEDRVNLRKSGTEEQYGEKEQLLQKIFDVARSHGYRIRPGAARKAAGASASLSQAPSEAPSRIGRTECRVASVVRDSTAATLHAEPESGDDSTAFGQQKQRNLRSTNLCATAAAVTSPPERPCEGLGESSQSPVPRTKTLQEDSTAGTRESSSAAGHGAGVGAAGFARRARKGRKRTADQYLEFFERRLALEAETREREAAQADRRLDIEERRLALQESQLQLDSNMHLQRVREFEEAHEERRQERAMLVQQNQLLVNVLQALVQKLEK